MVVFKVQLVPVCVAGCMLTVASKPLLLPDCTELGLLPDRG